MLNFMTVHSLIGAVDSGKSLRLLYSVRMLMWSFDDSVIVYCLPIKNVSLTIHIFPESWKVSYPSPIFLIWYSRELRMRRPCLILGTLNRMGAWIIKRKASMLPSSWGDWARFYSCFLFRNKVYDWSHILPIEIRDWAMIIIVLGGNRAVP